MIAVIVMVLLIVEHVSPSPTSFAPEEDESSTYSPDSLHLSEKYSRVMKKMTDYCDQPYNEMDDKIIDMYTICFSNLLQAVSNDVAIIIMVDYVLHLRLGQRYCE